MSPIAHAVDADANIAIEGDSYAVTAWSWSVTYSGTVHTAGGGGGGGGGPADYGNLTLESTSSRFTVTLMELIATGVHLNEVTLTDGNVTLLMENVIVKSVSVSKPERHVASLQFAKYTYSTNSLSTCFEISENQPC